MTALNAARPRTRKGQKPRIATLVWLVLVVALALLAAGVVVLGAALAANSP